MRGGTKMFKHRDLNKVVVSIFIYGRSVLPRQPLQDRRQIQMINTVLYSELSLSLTCEGRALDGIPSW